MANRKRKPKKQGRTRRGRTANRKSVSKAENSVTLPGNSTATAPQPYWDGDESHDSLITSRAYVCTKTVPEVLTDIEQLRKHDRSAEMRKTLFSVVVVIGIALGVAAVLALNTMFALGVVLMAVGVGVVVVFAAFSGSSRKLDLEDRRYEVAAGFLRLIQVDMVRGARVSVQMDLRPTMEEAKRLTFRMMGHWMTHVYFDRWLDMSGQLVDGSKWLVALVDKCQDRTKEKTSPSGRVKRKTKQKWASEAILRIKIGSKRRNDLKLSEQKIRSALQLAGGGELKKLRVNGATVTLRASMPADWEVSDPPSSSKDAVRLLASMLLSVFHVVNQAA